MPLPLLPPRWRALPVALVIALAAALAAVSGNALAQTNAQKEVAALLAQGQAQQALTQAEAAIAHTPKDPQLRFLRANALLALGQTQAADEAFTHLTQTWPELPEPWNNLATIRASQGRLAEARQLLEQALRNNPDYAQAHANLAQVLAQQALEHAQTAARLAPAEAAALAPRMQALQQAVK
ncbi:MAG: tetratricopeptide repeat protein [Comamonadaceae bacterium]|nr:tetratricopeptide repeat protein [Comamonadaceae bacterium]